MSRAVAKVLLLAAALALSSLGASAEMVWNRGNSGDLYLSLAGSFEAFASAGGTPERSVFGWFAEL